jgi:hypothetical protein
VRTLATAILVSPPMPGLADPRRQLGLLWPLPSCHRHAAAGTPRLMLAALALMAGTVLVNLARPTRIRRRAGRLAAGALS